MSADKKPISEAPVVPPSCPTGCSEQDWKTAALECLQALRLMNAHYDDISKSNPGFMGKLCLQRYDLWNEALLSSERTLRKYSHIPNPSHHDGAAPAPSVDGVVGSLNQEEA